MRNRVNASSTAALALILSFGCFDFVQAQIENIAPPQPLRGIGAAEPQQIPEPPANLPNITREQRQQSYAKLLEGQRYFWTLQNRRTKAGIGASARLARQSLIKAVELNPNLAEAYTALAEVASLTGGDVAEIVRAAGFAVRVDPNNFGAHRLLARVYTSQSNLGDKDFKPETANKAIAEWVEIARLEPRSAEAWAFLSEFYGANAQTAKQIEALEKWRGAAAGQDERFFQSVTGKPGLSSDVAAAEYGKALIKANRTAEALDVLTKTFVDNPTRETFAALQQVIEQAAPQENARAIGILQQTAVVNPGNSLLLELLTSVLTRANRQSEAAQVLLQASERLASSDQTAASKALEQLGALYVETGREADAIAAFENALKARNIGNQLLVEEAEREFASNVLPRLVAVYRNAGQTAKARETILRLGALLGTTDPSADLQLIELQRFSGDQAQALQTVRAARKRFPEDANLLRLEAEVLAESGKVDEGVALLRAKIVNKTKQIGVPSALRNDFVSHLVISNLYTQNSRAKDAVVAARQALDLAQDSQMTNIALLTLATAENASGDLKSAEISLREVLKQEPNNATALNNLGYFLAERGERLPEAVELIKRAIEIMPTNPSFMDSLGWAYFKSGQLAEAEKLLTEAARRSPNSADIQDHLGDLYNRQGKSQQAVANWRRALNLTKDAAEIARLKNKIGAGK